MNSHIGAAAIRKNRSMSGPAHAGKSERAQTQEIPTDPYRAILFPNTIREQRQKAGISSLLALSQRLPQIPYIRLSKIERGEVIARPPELHAIADELGLDDPANLLIDVEDPGFSVAKWGGLRKETAEFNRAAMEMAMLLAAAFRARRAGDPELTLGRLQEDNGLPAVIVSRIENAAKPIDRWNNETMAGVCRLFGVDSRADLFVMLREKLESGALTEWLKRIPGAREREARTREHVAALRAELVRTPPASPKAKARISAPEMSGNAVRRRLTILGIPGEQGVIEPVPEPQTVEVPEGTGPNAFALRMCRPSLGATIPGNAVLIVDPDRYPAHGGLAVLTEKQGLRVLCVTTDREGHIYGHSSIPEEQRLLDTVPPSHLAMVIAILFP